ncbi:MAG: cysteine--tRNA ligase [Thermodesulfovibrionales bacterium]|nr:cysteine--tRNA ligase [Thermodesulfovibrionales bacterium]
MKVYNTLTGKKEPFIPLNDKKVGIYACGVTVYDYCHIGHARSAVVFDVIVRYLRYRGYDVTFVRNFTDIDDKIIKKANEMSLDWNEVSERFIDEYYTDMDALGIARADYEPKATEHINEMIHIIETLIKKGYAYTIKEGDSESVYFEVSKFKEYGKLSKKTLDELIAGARVDINEQKKSPMDFALWKASKEGEPWWQSPWGKGRPGWHIECTAMSIKHIGETLDIHGGGADLIFPHHENEIAQSEAYTDKPFSKYWIHNGFITIDKEKMSKSLGNFFTIREILQKYDAEVVRCFLLSSHYRSPLEFSEEQLKEAESLLDRYYTTLERIEDYIKQGEMKGKKKDTNPPPNMDEEIQKTFSDFHAAMDDDFNTALAIGVIFDFLRTVNRYIDCMPPYEDAVRSIDKIKDTLTIFSGILNIFKKSPSEWQLVLLKSRGITISNDEIMRMIEERNNARKLKDYQRADSIRSELEKKGIILEDKKGETVWKVAR